MSGGNGNHIQVFCRVRPYTNEDSISLTFPDAIEYLEGQRRSRASASSSSNPEDANFEKDDERNACLHLMKQSPAQIIVGEKSSFGVDRLFYGITQEEIYEETVRSMIQQELFQGIHCTLFSYGQTGSGKTHTLIGSHQQREERGLLPRSLEQIFEAIDDQCNQNIAYSCDVKVSIVEIYHEKLKDLLGNDFTVNSATASSSSSSSSGQTLAIREQSDGTIYVENLKEISIYNVQDFQKLLSIALKRRVTGGHKLNEHSSRSHLCCLINVTQIDKANSTEISSKLSIIDLAGSEMAKKTEAAGQRFQEAKFINKSLSALSKVISALTANTTSGGGGTSNNNTINNENNNGNFLLPSSIASNQGIKLNSSLKLSSSMQLNNSNNKDGSGIHVPYRDSKLTRLLQNSLSGSNKTVIILTISPLKQHMSETISTLKFGERARLIKIMPKVHQHTVEKDENLRGIIKDLKSQIQVLQQTIGKMQEEAAAQALLMSTANSNNVNQLVKEFSPAAETNSVVDGGSRLVTAICEVCQAFIDQSLHSEDEVKSKNKKASIQKKKKVLIEKGVNSCEHSPRGDELTSNSNFIFFPAKESSTPAAVKELTEDDNSASEGEAVPEEGRNDEEDDDDQRNTIDEEEIIDRCAICGMNSEESEQLKIDTGEELGFLFNCDGNCGNKFHIRCIGIVGDGGQYMMPEGEWFCTACTTDIHDTMIDTIAPQSPQTPRLLRMNPETMKTPVNVALNSRENSDTQITNLRNGDDEKDEEKSTTNEDHQPLETLDQISTPQVQSDYYPKPENLISAFQNLHFRYELMRKERNRILLHWQNEKKTQQRVEALKQKKQAKDQEERMLYLEEKQTMASTLKSLEDENAYLRRCLQDIREEVVATSHRKHRKQGRRGPQLPGGGTNNGENYHNNIGDDHRRSASHGLGEEHDEDGEDVEEWQSLSQSHPEFQKHLMSGSFSGLFGEKERVAALQEDDNINMKKDSKPLPSKESPSSHSYTGYGNNDDQDDESTLPKPKPWEGSLRKSSSEVSLSPNSKETSAPMISAPSVGNMNGRSKGDKLLSSASAVNLHKSLEFEGKMTEEDSLSSKEHSRFVNPLKNRLSDLLAKAKEEADSYAEIRNRYQNMHRDKTLGGDS